MSEAKVSVNSDCQCYDCPQCRVGYIGGDYGQKCDECAVELSSSDTCMGCWDDSEEAFYSMLEEWKKEVGVDRDFVRISGSGMGWQGSKGYAVVPLDKALGALTLRGDFRIEATRKGRELSARRWSHDEPTGNAVFRFTLVLGEED